MSFGNAVRCCPEKLLALAVALMLEAFGGAAVADGLSGDDVIVRDFDELVQAIERSRQTPGRDRILLADGDYFFTRTIRLDERDRGLVIEALDGARPVLRGGIDLRKADWQASGDGMFRLSLAGLDLPRGVLDFHIGGVQLRQARYPNAVDGDPTRGWLFAASGTSGSSEVRFDPSDLPEFDDPEGLRISIVDQRQWTSNVSEVARIDRVAGAIQLADAVDWHELGEGSRYFLFGIADMLDAVGEWHFDARSAVLSVKLEDASVLETAPSIVASVVDGFFAVERADHVTIAGLAMVEASPHGSDRGAPYYQAGGGAVRVVESDAVTIRGNSIRDVGVGISAHGVVDLVIEDNEIRNVAGNGILLRPLAGGRLNDNVRVAGNLIRNVGTRFVESAGIWFVGTKDSLFARNDIRRASQFGIVGAQFLDDLSDPVVGNEISGNRIAMVNIASADGGGIKLYARRPKGSVDNEISGNWIDGVSHLMNRKDGSFFAADDWQPSRWPQPVGAGIYLDWNSHEVRVIGNIVTDSYGGVIISNSSSSLVEGNLIHGGQGAGLFLHDTTDSAGGWGGGNIVRRNILVRLHAHSNAVTIYQTRRGGLSAEFQSNVHLGEALDDDAFVVDRSGFRGRWQGGVDAWQSRHRLVEGERAAVGGDDVLLLPEVAGLMKSLRRRLELDEQGAMELAGILDQKFRRFFHDQE